MRESERHRKLVEYFKKNLEKGYTSDTLRWALVDQGNSRVAVDKALEQANQEMLREKPILSEKPVIRREVYGDDDKPIPVAYKKKPFWKKFLGIE